MESANSTSSLPPRQRLFWLLVCIGILAGGFIIMRLLQAFAPQPQQVESSPTVPVVQLQTLRYRDTPLLVTGNGLVQPRARITLSAQVSGEVTSISPKLVSGGHFEKDEVMLEIDDRNYRANLEEARAARAALESSLGYLEKQIGRLQSLRENDLVQESNLDELISQRDQLLANIAGQEATIQNRELDLERTRITAPFSGFIQSENVDPGDIVSPGVELARFYASDNAEIVTSLNVNDAAFIPELWRGNNNGRQAWVEVDYAGDRYRWPAQLDRVQSDLDQTSRTINVVVRVDDPTQAGEPVSPHLSSQPGNLTTQAPPLLVGMYATVHIEGMTLAEHFVLPIEAVHNGHIWIMDNENRLQVEPVELIRQEGNQAVLQAPALSEGANIIVSQIALVSDNMQVRPTPVEEQAGEESP